MINSTDVRRTFGRNRADQLRSRPCQLRPRRRPPEALGGLEPATVRGFEPAAGYYKDGTSSDLRK